MNTLGDRLPIRSRRRRLYSPPTVSRSGHFFVVVAHPSRAHRHTRTMTEDAGRLRVASALEATGAYDGPLDLDLGNLAASDPSPIDPDVFGRKPSDVATAAARVAPCRS